MRTFCRIVGYALLLAPFLLLALTARDWYIGVLIGAYGVTAALLTLE